MQAVAAGANLKFSSKTKTISSEWTNEWMNGEGRQLSEKFLFYRFWHECQGQNKQSASGVLEQFDASHDGISIRTHVTNKGMNVLR